MINEVCSCGCIVFTINPVGPHLGLYCNDCGKWLKWLKRTKKSCNDCINMTPDHSCGAGCDIEHLVDNTIDSDEVDEADEGLPW